jgi:hypothetical protein
MEKVIALIWGPQDMERAAFNERLLASLPPALVPAGASNIRINLEDEISAAVRAFAAIARCAAA